MAFTPEQLHSALRKAPACQRFVVALSGGVDSVSLAHALVQLARQGRVVRELHALHVHHGLHPDADRWQQFCQTFCNRMQLPLTVRQVRVDPEGSVEGAARDSRYRAFADFVDSGDLLLLAHHGDDQLETLLLRLMRGAGVHGLSGMPLSRALGCAGLYRPLLGFSRQEIETYARDADLRWAEDPDNQQLHHDRNFLRHRILPLLEQRWPGYRQAWHKSRQLLAETGDVLSEMAQQDLRAAGLPDSRVALAVLGRLSDFRLRNALRHWLQLLGLPDPGWHSWRRITAAQLATAGGSEGQLLLQTAGYQLRSYDGYLYALACRPRFEGRVIHLPLKLNRTVSLPDNGELLLRPGRGGGISGHFANAQIRFRRGGEQLSLLGRPAKSLKKLFQEYRIAPWLRERMPLVFIDDALAWVPGIGVAEFACAQAGEADIDLHWVPPRLELQPGTPGQ